LPADFDRTEIEDLLLINPLEIPNKRIVFESVKKALEIFKFSKLHVKHEFR